MDDLAVKLPPQLRPEAEPATNQLRSIVELALQRGTSVEVLERILALQERYDANEARKAFNRAIAELQPRLPQIIKTEKVDFAGPRGRTQYSHEDLAKVLEEVREPMSAVGLSVRWGTRSDAKSVTVTVILSHVQGHSEESELTANHDHSGGKNDIQAVGSAVSYLQRYTLKAILGLAAAKDDDGQRAGELTGSGATETGGADKAGQPDPRPERVKLWQTIFEFFKGDRDRAMQVLRELTGKASYSSLSDPEAKAGMEKFKQLYLDVTNLQPPPDDDIP